MIKSFGNELVGLLPLLFVLVQSVIIDEEGVSFSQVKTSNLAVLFHPVSTWLVRRSFHSHCFILNHRQVLEVINCIDGQKLVKGVDLVVTEISKVYRLATCQCLEFVADFLKNFWVLEKSNHSCCWCELWGESRCTEEIKYLIRNHTIIEVVIFEEEWKKVVLFFHVTLVLTVPSVSHIVLDQQFESDLIVCKCLLIFCEVSLSS